MIVDERMFQRRRSTRNPTEKARKSRRGPAANSPASGSRVEEVPRERWRSFFRTFSRAHEHWLATLEVFEPSRGTEVVVHDRPLEGISLDGERIVIAVNGGPEAHFSHIVEAPRSVLLETEGGRAEKAITILSGGGRTEVRFRSTLPPEMVDGLTR